MHQRGNKQQNLFAIINVFAMCVCVCVCLFVCFFQGNSQQCEETQMSLNVGETECQSDSDLILPIYGISLNSEQSQLSAALQNMDIPNYEHSATWLCAKKLTLNKLLQKSTSDLKFCVVFVFAFLCIFFCIFFFVLSISQLTNENNRARLHKKQTKKKISNPQTRGLVLFLSIHTIQNARMF